jgi:hypothetical protein
MGDTNDSPRPQYIVGHRVDYEARYRRIMGVLKLVGVIGLAGGAYLAGLHQGQHRRDSAAVARTGSPTANAPPQTPILDLRTPPPKAPAPAVTPAQAPAEPPKPKPNPAAEKLAQAKLALGRAEPLEVKLSERCPADAEGAVDYECYPTVKPTYDELQAQLNRVRELASGCLVDDGKAFECHLILGVTFAKLARWTGDAKRYPELGSKHYQQFVELAPRNNKHRPQVQKMLKAYAQAHR